jgi:hypothetical protein
MLLERSIVFIGNDVGDKKNASIFIKKLGMEMEYENLDDIRHSLSSITLSLPLASHDKPNYNGSHCPSNLLVFSLSRPWYPRTGAQSVNNYVTSTLKC